MRVGLIFGGRSVEHKVSITSARTVAQGLEQAGHTVVPLGLATDGCWVDEATATAALAGRLDRLDAVGVPVIRSLERLLTCGCEVLFPIVHGTWGEDGTLQGLCEMLDVPYVGPGVTCSAVCMDKAIAKRLLQAQDLPVVDAEYVTREAMTADADSVLRSVLRLPAPWFVKPSVGGSSVGIRRVEADAELRDAIEHALRFDDQVVVERGIAGRELEVAVLGQPGAMEASVIGEIVPGAAFYDYADKYLDDGARLLAPAELAEEVVVQLRQTAIRAFGAVSGYGMARVDFLLAEDDGAFFINEINTLPGFTSISMYPQLWELSGRPLPRLVDDLVQLAVQRHRRRRFMDEGIKSWIKELSERDGS